MIPKFYPGDIIACSIINHSRYIEWNKCHLIATIDRGMLVKRIMPRTDKDCLTAVSDNKEYPPFDIPKDEITGMARIVGEMGKLSPNLSPNKKDTKKRCVKTLAQPFSIIYSPVIFSFVYAAFFSFIW
nr:S24 family peptidase [uncultured Bacteroides sp.]